jgi:hypothetical protein
MKSPIFVDIGICIHSLCQHSVTEIPITYLTLDPYATENCWRHRRTCCDTLQVTFHKHSLPALCLGAGVQCLLCLLWQRHKLICQALNFSFLHVSCIIPSSLKQFTINFVTCTLPIELLARGISSYLFRRILVQGFYLVICESLPAVTCFEIHITRFAHKLHFTRLEE